MVNHLITIACSLAVGLAGSAGAPPDQRDARPGADSGDDGTRQAADASQEDEKTPEQLTAEDVLRELLKQRPPNEVIPPSRMQHIPGGTQRIPAGAKRGLLPEGSSLVERTGRIEFRELWWRFMPDAPAASPDVKLLPNAILEQMVRTEMGSAEGVAFVVSGEVTVFRNENYLLPRVAMRAIATGASTEPGDDASPPGKDAQHPGKEESVVVAEPSAEDVLKILRGIHPDKRVISNAASPVDEGLDGAPLAGHPAQLDGTPLVNRPGRVLHEAPWWTFTLESDHPDQPKPSFKLLPNQSVELMVDAVESGENGLVFLVSGEITAFGGENFLLPRVAMRRVDLGNLRK